MSAGKALHGAFKNQVDVLGSTVIVHRNRDVPEGTPTQYKGYRDKKESEFQFLQRIDVQTGDILQQQGSVDRWQVIDTEDHIETDTFVKFRVKVAKFSTSPEATDREDARFNLSGATIYNFAPGAKNSPILGGQSVQNNQVIGTQHNYAPEQKQTLAEAAAEIQQLLEQLSETYPTTTPLEQMTVATKAIEQIDNNPSLKQRIVSALTGAGTEAIKVAIDHPLASILVAAIEGWKEPE